MATLTSASMISARPQVASSRSFACGNSALVPTRRRYLPRAAHMRAQPQTRAEVIMDPKTKKLIIAPDAEFAPGDKRKESLEAYANIKRDLLKNLTTQGGVLSLYLTLVVDPSAGLSGFIGTAGAYLYIQLLSEYVDKLGTPGSWAPLTKDAREDELRRNPRPTAIFTSIPGKIGDIYRQALIQKRLLVPPLLALACWGSNTVLPEDFPVHLQLGFVLVGFLTYKTATLSWLWDNDLKPDLIDSITGKKEQDAMLARRPILAKIPDSDQVLAAKGKSMKDK